MNKAVIDVDKTARLANLRFTESEKVNIARDMEMMLDFADKVLSEGLRSETDPPDEHIIECGQEYCLLADIMDVNQTFTETENLKYSREKLLGNSPAVKDGYISVPNVIKRRSGT